MEITKFDTSEYFKTPETQKILLQDALESKDSKYLAHALGIIAKNQGMSKIAQNTGLSRESLYRSLSDKGDPRLSTFLSVLSALDLQISLTPVQNDSEKQTVLEEAS
ncbi:addiction module antidote protein [Bartonella machadoae]|uniref:addiction module antidote protein n=1 Tax=Bartonella machadoae TaxID=2893471 RepID=UPI001F4C87DC|nr:addiction module antidote protein [Bartonella machadoae]UNE54374.1 putative addiction module antidote protein [Bartonella machadoae]UNE54445.1 putative addiction module antidote protein [Bartonella machadoae]